MYCSSFFHFVAFATLAALVDISYAAPQAPGFPMFGRPGVPPFNPPKSSGSTVCFTSSKAPAVRGRPTTKYTTVTTCTTTSTVVVTTTVSPPPAVTTSTIVTTSTTTGPVSTDTATTSVVMTTVEMTTLPVSTIGTVTTVTQTVSVRDSTFKYAADTLPPATFSRRKRFVTPPGTSPNPKFKFSLSKSLPVFGGDVSCMVYQSQCAVITKTATSTTTLTSTTVTSLATSTVVVTSIPIANTTVTTTSTTTTTSTITPDPIITTSTVNTTTTTTVHVDKCSPSNIIGGINGMGSTAFGWDLGDYSSAGANTALDCCLSVTANPNGALWTYYQGSCYMVSFSTCSGINQSLVSGYTWVESDSAPGSGFISGNANCGVLNSWTQID